MEIIDQTLFVMPNWKWIMLAATLIGGWILRPILRGSFKKAKSIPSKWPQVQDQFWGHLLELKIEMPLSGIVTAILWIISLDAIAPPDGLKKYILIILHLWLAFNIIILFYLIVDAIGVVMIQWSRKSSNGLENQLVPFATKTLKILVVILGILVLLQNLGINVMSLLAGLSLGGLALALAAQETFANLFGSITIFADGPFKVGDQIKIGDTEGTVEEVGFRSTRIRTYYNSLVTLPNSVVAKEKIDNLGLRPARRVTRNLGVTYDTSPEKIEQFCDAIEYYLKHDTDIDAKTVQVYFTNYSPSSLDIMMNYHILTVDAEKELQVTEKVNLEIWKIAQSQKVNFAYPTQTVFYKNQSQPTP
jgi:MscS family membrane protein